MTAQEAADESPPPKKGFTFWMIFLSICLAMFLSALEFSGIATALPTIIDELHGDEFVWVGAAYALASTAFLPLSGGLAEIFGRRLAMLFALGCFIIGSALCGAAQSMSWLVAARTIQGLGGGAIQSISSIIVSDLVSLRERGVYNGLIGLTWAVASAIGPAVGGGLAAHGQWRWFFYLNLPMCGVTVIMVTVFLKLPVPPGTLRSKIGRMDWIGNILVISSTTAVVIALTWGGVQYPWKSAHVLIPLVAGLCGLAGFFAYEASYARHPIVPVSLLQNRTSVSGYIQTFICQVVSLAVTYYIPTYFQSCKDASPIRSAVDMLGLSASIGPIVVAAGVSVSVLKVYRPQLWIAWSIWMIGMGFFSRVGADSSMAQAIGWPILMGAGAGILFAVTYFPVLSPLPVSQNAPALAFFAFCRSFAGVWGISIGASVLQNELSHRLPSEFLSQFGSAADLSYAAIPAIRSLPPGLKDDVRRAFGESIAVIWKVMVGVLGIGFLSSLLMQDVPLHEQVDKKWGIEQRQSDITGGEMDVFKR
ncbi:Mfs1.2 [Polyporus arcularius HHB13444]|uniref:Mfs1.2 n=1 Tax=Polyporus arcularius HHB13444 TaxID=1314778 RepID=A0A5C3P548_9APHY|nr:Mfs1.2 [Polyporus arcularius HHB13444]